MTNNTMTNTTTSRSREHNPRHQRRGSLLRALTPVQRQLLKDDFRRHCAAAAGANDAQLTTLRTLEKGFHTHYPTYTPGPDGTLNVAYTAPQTGTIQAVVHTDGTVRVKP